MVESLPEPIQIALGLALLPVSLSPKSFNHAAPTQRGLITPPCLCCGCAAAVVAIAAETIKTVAMRVFHWNMTPPSYIAHKSMPEMACGFRLRRGRGLHGAYMACDKFADHKLRARKSGEIEMRPPPFSKRRSTIGHGVGASADPPPLWVPSGS